MCSASQAGCESHGMWELKKLKFRTDPVIDGYWITLRSSYLTSRSSHWLSVNDRILFRSVEDINIKASKFQKLKSRVGSSCSNLLHCSILLSTSVFYWRVCAQLCSFNFHPGLQNLAGKGEPIRILCHMSISSSSAVLCQGREQSTLTSNPTASSVSIVPGIPMTCLSLPLLCIEHTRPTTAAQANPPKLQTWLWVAYQTDCQLWHSYHPLWYIWPCTCSKT